MIPLILAALALPQDNQDAACARLMERARANPRLHLDKRTDKASEMPFVQGHYRVFEDRASRKGREIRLALVVLPARASRPAADPIFLLHGGPGAAATAFFRRMSRSWLRERRDIVLIDQRGTGRSNPLRVGVGNDADLQSYFRSMFQREAYEAALPRLKKVADLKHYTTPNAVDDFDEVRRALGYRRINLRGGSYGSRAALVYMRRHPKSIRTATLQGIQPIAYRNPLPHAASAQAALDMLFEECRSERYRDVFPDLENKFKATLERLDKRPARVSVRHPATSAETTIELDRATFAECVRILLYTMPTNRRLPLLLTRAHAGDFREMAQRYLASTRGARRAIAFGALMCVTESEDLSRIDPEEIEAACAGTFLGTTRIRNQMAIAEFWPSGSVSPSFGEPVRASTPTLLFSGTHDPATSPRWGAEAARHLPNALHVVVPGGHGVSGRAVRRLDRAFLEAGNVEGLDLSEIERLRLPPLVLPK